MGEGKWGVRYGLAAIKGVGEAACGMMLAERDENGPFKNLEDFARRVDGRAVNKRILEGLIKSGAFDWTGEDRAAMFVRIDQAIAAGASTQRDKAAGQFSLFGDELDAAPAPAQPQHATDTPSLGAPPKCLMTKRNCSASTSPATRSTAGAPPSPVPPTGSWDSSATSRKRTGAANRNSAASSAN